MTTDEIERPAYPMSNAITIGDKYGPAMSLTEQAQADAYFELCVDHCMRLFDKPRHEAERIERANLGYFAGHYDRETRQRVFALFRTRHPIFGTEEPTTEDALFAGFALAQAARNRSDTE